LGAFVGVITYLSYGYLNQAWSNWVLVAISIFMFLSLPLYSKYSNRIEDLGARWTQLETGGRVARYLFQLLDNMLLLWVYVAGGVINPAALEGIGGFFATAAWITMVSQGGQYLASYLARRGIGSGISLGLGALIFGLGLMADTKRLLEKPKSSVLRPWI
jgi:hypothetical protein